MIWSIEDTRPRNARLTLDAEVIGYLRDIKKGFGHFRSPSLSPYIPLMLVIQALFYTTDAGLLRPVLLNRFEFDPFWGSVVVGLSSLATVGVLAYMHRKAGSLSERRVFLAIGALAASSLMLSAADIGHWGLIVIFVLHAGGHVMVPFMSEVLNHRTAERHRATVLSIASFFRALPYVAMAPAIGFLNTNGDLHYFLVAWALLVVLALSLYLTSARDDVHVSLDE